MTDEIETPSANPTLEAPIVTAAPKKVRGPNKKKEDAKPIVATSEPAAATSAPVKRGPKSAKETQVSLGAPITSKTTKNTTEGKIAGPKKIGRPPAKAVEPLPAVDEFSDLLKLEEENKALRKALADKLRLENADLRKRLGQD